MQIPEYHLHCRWYSGMKVLKSPGKQSDTETVLTEQKMCVFINKTNQLKKGMLTKDAGRNLTTMEQGHTINSKQHFSPQRGRQHHHQEPPCLSLLHHPLQGHTSPSLFIHSQPTSKVAAAAGWRTGQSPS